MTQVIDLTGRRFGRLLVESRASVNTPAGQAQWICVCDCGASTIVRGADLRNMHTTSCGCLHIQITAGIAAKHNKTHGMTLDPIYAIWNSMLARCRNPKHKAFHLYGGRGIKVCQEWLQFDRFYSDFGHARPSRNHSIDRWPDNDGNYEPGNVRWALQEEQQNNRRDTVLITHQGETLSIAQWSRRVGIGASCIAKRLKSGWPQQAALTEPPNANRRFL